MNKKLADCFRILSKGVLFGVLLFLIDKAFFTLKFKNRYSDYLLRSLDGPLKYDDPELIRYIKEKFIEPPSTKPYNIKFHKKNKFNSEIFYRNFTKDVLVLKRNGFFVEAGALDGQAMSNTLYLEMQHGWTGLLIEPDPSNYIALKRKHRKAWTAKVCLSNEDYAKQEQLSSFDIIANIREQPDPNFRAMGTFVYELKNSTFHSKSLTNDETSNSYYVGQCLPLASLLLAMNVTHVDLLSLDVEFNEDQIIRHFPFHRFDIQVIFIEWWNHGKARWMTKFFQEKGYHLVMNILADFIFVKKNSSISRIVDEKKLWREFFADDPNDELRHSDHFKDYPCIHPLFQYKIKISPRSEGHYNYLFKKNYGVAKRARNISKYKSPSQKPTVFSQI